MKTSLTALAASVWICGALHELHATDLPHPTVRAVILEQQKYCLGQPGGILNEVLALDREPPEAITLRLTVQLSFRNAGSKPLIAPRVYQVSALIVSRTLDDAARRRHQLVIPYKSLIPYESLEPSGDELEEILTYPDDSFELILPGRFASSVDLRGLHQQGIILRVRDPALPDERQLLGKKAFLQFELTPLQIPETAAKQLTRKWPGGYLWMGKVRTNAVETEIPASPQIADCSNLYKID